MANSHRSQSNANRYQTYQMAPLTLEKIEQLFKVNLGEDKGREIFSAIKNIHDLPGLAKRPITARFISEMSDSLMAIHQQGKSLNIATVYDILFQRGIERD